MVINLIYLSLRSERDSRASDYATLNKPVNYPNYLLVVMYAKYSLHRQHYISRYEIMVSLFHSTLHQYGYIQHLGPGDKSACDVALHILLNRVETKMT